MSLFQRFPSKSDLALGARQLPLSTKISRTDDDRMGCDSRGRSRVGVDVELRSDYIDYMITNLREAKSNLSQLVQLAANGEEIIITVRGRPTARLTGVVATQGQSHDRKAWAEELVAAAKAACAGPRQATSQQFWDELRGERS